VSKTELEDSRLDGAGVAAHDFAAAMGENGVFHALLSAPCELCANRRVPDQVMAAPAHHGPGHRGAVADVERHTAQRLRGLADGRQVGYVKRRDAPGSNSIADRGGPQRMLNGEGLEADRVDAEGVSGLNCMSIGEWKALNQRPGLVRGMDRAGRALREPEGVV
jgi:hypothetical protein